MTWSTSERTNFRHLLVKMLLRSANPNKEWSVKHVLSPIALACMMASRDKLENAYSGGYGGQNMVLHFLESKY